MKKEPNNPKFCLLFLFTSKLSSHLGKPNYSVYPKNEQRDQITQNIHNAQHQLGHLLSLNENATQNAIIKAVLIQIMVILW